MERAEKNVNPACDEINGIDFFEYENQCAREVEEDRHFEKRIEVIGAITRVREDLRFDHGIGETLHSRLVLFHSCYPTKEHIRHNDVSDQDQTERRQKNER
jgi:hypothetical protein